MDPTEGKNSGNTMNLKRKYIRLMTVGMSFWLAILPGLVLAEMFGLTCYAQIAVLLSLAGCVFFFFGLIGRQELPVEREPDENTTDCSK